MLPLYKGPEDRPGERGWVSSHPGIPELLPLEIPCLWDSSPCQESVSLTCSIAPTFLMSLFQLLNIYHLRESMVSSSSGIQGFLRIHPTEAILPQSDLATLRWAWTAREGNLWEGHLTAGVNEAWAVRCLWSVQKLREGWDAGEVVPFALSSVDVRCSHVTPVHLVHFNCHIIYC